LGARLFGLGEHPRQKGGARTGPNPTDKGKAGSKRHEVVVEGSGIPLAVSLTAANVHDSMVFEDLIDGIGPIKRPRGRPRKRPEKLHADKAYDDKKCARALRKRGIKRRIARKGVESSKKLGRHRDGSWSGRWLGSPNTAGSLFVTSGETTSMKRSYLSAVL